MCNVLDSCTENPSVNPHFKYHIESVAEKWVTFNMKDVVVYTDNALEDTTVL